MPPSQPTHHGDDSDPNAPHAANQFTPWPTRLKEVVASDGIRLVVRETVHDTPPRRTLLVIHGGLEHGGRYAAAWTAAAHRGFRVLIPDHRGHGLSGGRRCDVPTFETYLHDLTSIVETLVPGVLLSPRNDQPQLDTVRASLSILAHSFGGLIATNWLAGYTAADSATATPFTVIPIVLTSPMFGLRLPIPRWKSIAAPVIATCWPTLRFRAGIRAAALTTDAAAQAKNRDDPLIQRSVTARWFVQSLRGMQMSHETAVRFHHPLLLMQGTDEQVTNPEAAREWFGHLASTDRTWCDAPANRHEILNGPRRDAVLSQILDWLELRPVFRRL